MGDKFRLGLNGLCKLRLQHLGNLLVELLAFAFEQRLVGCILNEGMFEEVPRLRGQPALVDQLCLH